LLSMVFLTITTSGCMRLLARDPYSQLSQNGKYKSEEFKQKSKLSYEELQGAVMSYADSFALQLADAADELEKTIQTDEARVQSARLRVYTLASAFDIAVDPNPAVAMLDMVVMVTLTRIVWEEYWYAKVFGEESKFIVDTFRKLENDIWAIAEKELTPQQQEDLRETILEWRRTHPKQVSADYIRFSDFGELGLSSSLKNLEKPGGLFASVKEAVQAADEIRLLGERAMYLFTRMQLLINEQSNLILTQLLTQPEVKQLLSDTSDFKETSERITVLLEQLPAEIDKQRTQLMKDFLSEEEGIRPLLADLRETLILGQAMMKQVNETLISSNTLVTQLGIEPSKNGAEEFDIKEYQNLVVEVSNTASRVKELNESVLELLNAPGLLKTITQVRQEGEHFVGYSIYRTILVILIFFVCLVFSLLLYKYLSKRLIG